MVGGVVKFFRYTAYFVLLHKYVFMRIKPA